MTMDEKYLGLINFPKGTEIKPNNGKDNYIFPCPICSTKKTNSGKLKPNKKTAILMYSDENDCYVFNCLRCKTKGNLLNFLLLHQPYLAEHYKAESSNHNLSYKKWEKNRHYSKQTLPFNFKPNFN